MHKYAQIRRKTMPEYKYKAFISYRHLEPDMQAAEKLQKLLESYKPPKNLGKTKDNWRIFRDVSELQSSSDLSEDIRNAIETSEYLIVICSPKYTESKWCMQELTRFRELHGNTNENIITLLVSGEPQESFPEELTYTEMTTTNEKGEEVKVKVEVEPLAANIKADTLKESMKKLNTEYLRIAAPLLGCDFNDLFQREKRREAARRRRIFGGVSGILSLITVISVASAVTISGKNVQIKKQNSQIKEQNEQIAQKNSDLLIENAGHLASESENLFKENSLIPAIQKAVQALPGEGEDKPVLPEAEYALSRELGLFRHSQLSPQLTLRHECAVEQISFMGGGKTIVSQDATGIYFWDAETGKLIKKLTGADSEFASAKNSTSNTLTAHLDVSRDKTGTYYNKVGTPSRMTYDNDPIFNKVYTSFVHAVDDDEPGTGGDVYIANSDSTIWRLDGVTGEVKWKAPASENAFSYYPIVYGEKNILRMYRNAAIMPGGTRIFGNDIHLEVIDAETGSITEDVVLSGDFAKVSALTLDYDIEAVVGNTIYSYFSTDNVIKTFEIKDHAISAAETVEVEGDSDGIHSVSLRFIENEPVVASANVLGFGTSTSITRYSGEMKEKKWTAKIPVNYLANGDMFLMPADCAKNEHAVLVVTTKTAIALVDYETGSLIRTIPLDSDIIDVSYTRTGLIMFTLSSGEEYTLSIGSFITGDDTDNCAYRIQTMGTALSLYSYSRGRYVTADSYSNTAYIQYVKDNPMYTDIDIGEYMFDRNVLAVSEGGDYAVISATHYPDGEYGSGTELTNHLFIYERGSGKCSEVSSLSGHKVNAAAFAGKDTVIVNATPVNGSGGYTGKDVTAAVSIPDGTSRILTDAPHVNRTVLKLVPTGEGVFYLSDSERSINYVSASGEIKQWSPKEEDEFALDKEIVEEKYAVRGKKAALLAKFNGDEVKTSLIIHDFDLGQHVTLEYDADADEKRTVQHIFWQNDSTVGVLFSDRTVTLFDAASGKQKAQVTLVGTSQEPVSVAPVTEDRFAVLCRDSKLYEMDENGFTGRSCRLDFSSVYDNKIREYDSSSAALLGVQPASDASHRFVVWDDSQAWLLDTEKFVVRYRVDDFAAAPSGSDIVFISDAEQNKTGFFPVYSTQQLLDAAKGYLAALGES